MYFKTYLYIVKSNGKAKKGCDYRPATSSYPASGAQWAFSAEFLCFLTETELESKFDLL
jgi:hypothetical protein